MEAESHRARSQANWFIILNKTNYLLAIALRYLWRNLICRENGTHCFSFGSWKRLNYEVLVSCIDSAS